MTDAQLSPDTSGPNHFLLSLESLVLATRGLRCAFWACTPGLTRVLYVNPAFRFLFGSNAEARGSDSSAWLTSLHPDDAVQAAQALKQWRNNEAASIQYRLCKSDGSEMIVSESGLPIFDAAGRVAWMCGIAEIVSEEQLSSARMQVFNRIAQQMKDPIILTGQDSQIRYVNQAFIHVYGYSAEEVTGRTSRILFGGSDAEFQDLCDRVDENVRASGSIRCEYRDRKKDGSLFWVSHIGSRIHLGDRPEPYFLAINRDISDLKKIEEELLHTNQAMRRSIQDLENRNHQLTLLNEMGDLMQSCLTRSEVYTVVGEYAPLIFQNLIGAVYVTDPATNVVEAAVTWGNLPDIERSFPARDCWSLRRGRTHMVDQQGFWLRCDHDTAQPGELWKSVCVPMNTNTETLGMLHLKVPPEAPFDHCTQLASIVSERIALTLTNLRLSERLRQQSVLDALTGLYNRPYMFEILEKEFKRAALHNLEAGVALMNVDHFDAFNEHYGFSAGDNLLIEITELIQKSLPAGSSAARYLADRFILLLPHFELEEARARLERLREQVKLIQPSTAETQAPVVTVSIGLAVYPRHGATPEQVVMAAETATSRARQLGRDCVVVQE